MGYKEWIPGAIKKLRGDATLKEFSEKVGISLSYLSDIETARTIPTIETLDKIATAGGCLLELSFTREGDYVPPGYLFIHTKDVEKLRAILKKLDDDNPTE